MFIVLVDGHITGFFHEGFIFDTLEGGGKNGFLGVGQLTALIFFCVMACVVQMVVGFVVCCGL